MDRRAFIPTMVAPASPGLVAREAEGLSRPTPRRRMATNVRTGHGTSAGVTSGAQTRPRRGRHPGFKRPRVRLALHPQDKAGEILFFEGSGSGDLLDAQAPSRGRLQQLVRGHGGIEPGAP